jgi:hypothetical protein
MSIQHPPLLKGETCSVMVIEPTVIASATAAGLNSQESAP